MMQRAHEVRGQRARERERARAKGGEGGRDSVPKGEGVDTQRGGAEGQREGAHVCERERQRERQRERGSEGEGETEMGDRLAHQKPSLQ